MQFLGELPDGHLLKSVVFLVRLMTLRCSLGYPTENIAAVRPNIVASPLSLECHKAVFHLVFRSLNRPKAEYERFRDQVPAASESVKLVIVFEQDTLLTLLRDEVVAANCREIAQIGILSGYNFASLMERARENRA